MPVDAFRKSPSQMTGEEKYDFLVFVFISFLMTVHGLSEQAATRNIAELCTIAQAGLIKMDADAH